MNEFGNSFKKSKRSIKGKSEAISVTGHGGP
jgi:hypothetical protein